jgi:DNA-binding transcriptional MerR regulator
MFRISDFSRLTRVTVKTLRHYDRLGLLSPARVDPETRYRYYAARQVAQLQRILVLRDLGFALEHIRDMLERKLDGRALAQALDARRVEIGRRLEADRLRLAEIESRIAELDSGDAPAAPDALVREIPPVRVAARRARVASLDAGVEELFERLEKDVAKAKIRADGPPILIYHDREYREEDATVEVAVPVLTTAKSVGGAAIRTLPGVPAASCVLYAGGYDQVAGVTRGLLGWLQSRRLQPAGPFREVFLQFGTRDAQGYEIPRAYLVDSPEDQLTELQIPVRSGRAPRRTPTPKVRPRSRPRTRPTTR